MKKKIILTEEQYIKLTNFLLENINTSLKHIKKGDVLNFKITNGQDVNLDVISVNIANNEILAYGPKKEKIMLRVGEFDDEKDTLRYYEYVDSLKKYVAKKVGIQNMDIFRNNELFVAPEQGNKPSYDATSKTSQSVGNSKYFQGIKPNNIINIIDINDNETSIIVVSVQDEEIYGEDKNGNDLVVKYIDEENKKILLLKNINNSMEETIINFKDINVTSDDDDDDDDDKSYGDDLFNKYYKEILNNPNLQKAFYTAPSLWNYILAAAKGEKAKGKGLYPAYQIVNDFFSTRIKDKLPGFTDKENKRATFYLLDTVAIRYTELNGKKNELIMEPRYYKATVRQYEAGLGDVKVLSYRSSGGAFGFKIAVKKPTGFKQDEYYCDVYVNNNKVEENTYVQKNVRVKFINSDGYTSYDNLKKNK
jgi:hypothetical protein